MILCLLVLINNNVSVGTILFEVYSRRCITFCITKRIQGNKIIRKTVDHLNLLIFVRRGALTKRGNKFGNL